MKQGKHYTTVILWIFIAAIAAYSATMWFPRSQSR